MSTSKRIKTGIIGCGEHAVENLIPCLWMSQDVEVVGVCDLDEAAAERVARRFPGAKAYTNFCDLLDEGKLQALIAAAPPQVHFQVATQALERGLHVFLEKPPVVVTEDLIMLTQIAERKGLVTMVGHNLRHATASRVMKSFVGSSEFGDARAMEVRYYASKPRGDRWSLGSPLRSFLLSHVNHAIDLMAFQVGRPIAVHASANGSPNGAISLGAQLEFENGAVGTLFASTNCPHFSLHATVIGSQGAFVAMESLYEVRAYGFPGDGKREGRQWIERQLDTGYQHAGYKAELDLFVRAVLREEPSHPSFGDEVCIYQIIDSIEKKIVENIPNEELSINI